MTNLEDNSLGNYLKNRRAKLDPRAFGISATRRRTPGLRREEVAQRANVSATWYTWLEQGRGGTPSADVLDGIASALALTTVEREHLFLLAQHRLPEVRYQAPEPITPQLQRVLDALPLSPALMRTTSWDVVAWNKAAAMVLTDFGVLAPGKRNILRNFFCNPEIRDKAEDWDSHARFVVASFRSEAVRTGAAESVAALVDELIRSSPEFASLWHDHDVGTHGEGCKRILHPAAGHLAVEYSTFAVDGRPDLSLLVYTAATPADADRIRSLVEGGA